MDSWDTSYKPNRVNNQYFHKAQLRPYGKWYRYNFGNKKCQTYCINSIFSLNKADILKFSINKYIYFKNLLEPHEHSEVCHYIERSWCVIFGPFIKTKMINYV